MRSPRIVNSFGKPMSQNEHDAGHESPIKTPKQLITVVALAFLVPILIIVLLSQFFANLRSVNKDSPAMAYDAVAKRLKPVGDLAFADATSAFWPFFKRAAQSGLSPNLGAPAAPVAWQAVQTTL